MPISKLGCYTGTKLPMNLSVKPPQTLGSLGRHVHKDRGYIEKKEIITTSGVISQYKYFLLVIDENTKKQLSVFGPFNTEIETKEFSNLHGIELI